MPARPGVALASSSFPALLRRAGELSTITIRMPARPGVALISILFLNWRFGCSIGQDASGIQSGPGSRSFKLVSELKLIARGEQVEVIDKTVTVPNRRL